MTKDDMVEIISRIDENVKTLVKIIPMVHKLEKDSAINKREHRFAFLLIGPILMWVYKKLGLPLDL